jgi:hypothetical protein
MVVVIGLRAEERMLVVGRITSHKVIESKRGNAERSASSFEKAGRVENTGHVLFMRLCDNLADDDRLPRRPVSQPNQKKKKIRIHTTPETQATSTKGNNYSSFT